MKKQLGVYSDPQPHWVGDGFPVRTLISYASLGNRISPFLLLDYAGPMHFEPTTTRRGVGAHPHRGFETVTIVYEGEIAHRDTAGNEGVIGPGDVQWMTAASGVLHEEFHTPDFAGRGGAFRAVQLWVNLPAKAKMTKPAYQAIPDARIPALALPQGAGRVRVIAGDYDGTKGPARTFTPMNVWDVHLNRGATAAFPLPEGHNGVLVALSGAIAIEGGGAVREAQAALLSDDGAGATVTAESDADLLVLTGEPIGEPIVGHGPFVMNSDAEIRQAIDDFNSGRFGRMPA